MFMGVLASFLLALTLGFRLLGGCHEIPDEIGQRLKDTLVPLLRLLQLPTRIHRFSTVHNFGPFLLNWEIVGGISDIPLQDIL